MDMDTFNWMTKCVQSFVCLLESGLFLENEMQVLSIQNQSILVFNPSHSCENTGPNLYKKEMGKIDRPRQQQLQVLIVKYLPLFFPCL